MNSESLENDLPALPTNHSVTVVLHGAPYGETVEPAPPYYIGTGFCQKCQIIITDGGKGHESCLTDEIDWRCPRP